MAVVSHPLAASPRSAVAANRLPRVLYALALDPGAKYGSLEEQLVFLAYAFRDEGSHFRPLFLADPATTNVDQFLARGVEADCLDLSRFSLGNAYRLWRLVQKARIDAIHWNFVAPITNSYVWTLTALCPTLRHIFTDHNSRLLPLPAPPRGWRRLFKRLLLKRYRQVWGVSDYVRDRLADQGVWSNLVSCRHFINTDRFRPDAEARQTQRAALEADGRFILVAVANLIPEKGLDVAIQAMTRLPERATLWIIGAGPERARLEDAARDLGVGSRVKLLGLQRHVQPFLQAADCFVCPSRWAEAAGLVNLEAHACGLPIVASRIGGIPEYVSEGQTGLFFEPGDADEMAAQVSRLMDDPDLHCRMSRHARVWTEQHFSPAARLPAILDLYRQLGR